MKKKKRIFFKDLYKKCPTCSMLAYFCVGEYYICNKCGWKSKRELEVKLTNGSGNNRLRNIQKE